MCAATSKGRKFLECPPGSNSFENSLALSEPRPTSTSDPITRRTILYRKWDAPILNNNKSPSILNRASLTTTIVDRSSARLSQKRAKS